MDYKHWTNEEKTYLEDYWGIVSIKGIAKKLGKSINGVKCKADKLGLGDPRFYLDGITVNQLMEALNIQYNRHYRWVKELDFPVKQKAFAIERKTKYVTYQDFWKWAEKNKEVINWWKVEKNILGAEPKWVDKQRRKDYQRNKRSPNERWTAEEEQRLSYMTKAKKYTYAELSKTFNRSQAAISKKIGLMGLPRPIRKNSRKQGKIHI